MENVMTKPLNPSMYIVLWLLLAGGVGFAYVADAISGGTLVFLELCVLILAVVAVVFWRKMTHPPESVEQLLYETDHPTRK